MIVKTNCQHCQQPLEFDASQDGEQVDCPHCTRQTVLLMPAKPVASPAPATNPRPKAWDVVENLEIIGVVYLILGLLAAAGVFVFGAMSLVEYSSNPWALLNFAWAAGIAIQAFIARTLFFAFAELIRKVRIIADKP